MFNFLATNAVTRAFLFLACIALTTGAPIGSTNDKDVIPNQWIVMFKDTTPDTVFAGYQKMFRKRSENSTVSVKHVYNAGSLRGFSLDGSLEDMESLDNEWVQTIEPNRRIYLDDMEQDTRNVSSLVSRGSRGTSTEGPWNLDQISHFGPVGKGPQPGRYLCPENCGAGVTIYIVDTGVDIDHPELTGRAEIGASFCDDQEDSR